MAQCSALYVMQKQNLKIDTIKINNISPKSLHIWNEYISELIQKSIYEKEWLIMFVGGLDRDVIRTEHLEDDDLEINMKYLDDIQTIAHSLGYKTQIKVLDEDEENSLGYIISLPYRLGNNVSFT